MSLATRVAALAQRIGAELHDTGWTDLRTYLRPEIAGMLRARTKAGVTIVHGEVTVPPLGTQTPGISDPVPSQFRPPRVEGDTYIAAPLLASPRISGGGYQFHANDWRHRSPARDGSLAGDPRPLHDGLPRGLSSAGSDESRDASLRARHSGRAGDEDPQGSTRHTGREHPAPDLSRFAWARDRHTTDSDRRCARVRGNSITDRTGSVGSDHARRDGVSPVRRPNDRDLRRGDRAHRISRHDHVGRAGDRIPRLHPVKSSAGLPRHTPILGGGGE